MLTTWGKKKQNTEGTKDKEKTEERIIDTGQNHGCEPFESMNDQV